MTRLCVLLIIASIMTVSMDVASAEVYRYTDSKGRLHFVDDISKVPKKYRRQLENPKPLADVSVTERTPASWQQKEKERSPQAQSSIQGSARVEVYVTSWCGYCKKMISFLNEKGIQYSAYDIEKDSNAERTYRELGGRGVPVVRIGDKIIYGYNPDEVLSSIGSAK